MSAPFVRSADLDDLHAIRRIYNEGIEDRIATLDEDPKSDDDIASWWADHGGRYAVLVAQDATANVVGWASLNRYSPRRAYRGVADLSVYVARAARGTGIGSALLTAIERRAHEEAFYKIVLFTLPLNSLGQRLYRKSGFREVGIFREQGRLDGHPMDVMAMEKLLPGATLQP